MQNMRNFAPHENFPLYGIYTDSLWGVLVEILEWVFTHGSGLGVVIGGVWIQVIEVFCCVLSDTQVPDSGPSFWIKFCAGHICPICIFIFIFISITVQGVLEGREVCLTNQTTFLQCTVEPPLTDILYSGHLIIQDKMLRSGLNLHYA